MPHIKTIMHSILGPGHDKDIAEVRPHKAIAIILKI